MQDHIVYGLLGFLVLIAAIVWRLRRQDKKGTDTRSTGWWIGGDGDGGGSGDGGGG